MSKNGKKFGPGVTKQAHTDECNINKIMARYQRTGTLAHIKANNSYSDLPEWDYEAICTAKAKLDSVYYSLPSEVRREIPSPGAFQDFVNSRTDEEILEQLPILAEPGTQWPAVNAAQKMAAHSLADSEERSDDGAAPGGASDDVGGASPSSPGGA